MKYFFIAKFIKKYLFFRLMENVPEDLYLPVMWFEAIGQMSSNSAPTIRFLLKMPYIASIIGPVIIIFNLLIGKNYALKIYYKFSLSLTLVFKNR